MGATVQDFLLQLINSVNNIFLNRFIIYFLLALGGFFTLRMGFMQLRLFPLMIRLLGAGGEKKEAHHGVSSFQAFAISVASRVGTGNLAGVAVAITMGGPGSIFWMWIMALLGMASAFVESSLAQLYKVRDGANHFRGGPAYYIQSALKNRFLATTFAVSLAITFGYIFNMMQANTIAGALQETFSVRPWITGLFLLIFTGLIIVGGVKRIAQFSAFFVPILAVSYVGVAFFVMMTNLPRVPEVFGIIFSNAFHGNAVAGGSLGTVIAIGIRRGLFSNEAGLGSAPAAAAAASTSHPAKQGLIQSFSVFTDTILVCTATAFIVVLAGLYSDPKLTGIVLMQRSLVAILGAWSEYYLTIIIFMFAFSSVVGNYYYGESSLVFIQKGAQWPLKLYKITVVMVIFLGAVAGYDLVWAMGDLFSGITAGINLYALILLYPLAVKLLQDFERQRKEGKDPVFKSSTLPEVTVECWD